MTSFGAACSAATSAVRGRFLRLLRVVCVALAPGAALAQTSPATTPAATDAPPVPSAAAAQRAAEVAVGAGDRIRMRIWREPTMSDDFLVDDRGEVTLPRLGPVHVEGNSIAAVRDTLIARYAVYLKNPSVDVIVFRRIGVQGEVRAPNLYYVDATKSIRDVVSEAGGPTENANRDRVTVVRNGRTVAVGRWQDGGPVGVDLRSGDQVIVARRSWWSINALALVGTLGVVVPVGLSLLNYFKK